MRPDFVNFAIQMGHSIVTLHHGPRATGFFPVRRSGILPSVYIMSSYMGKKFKEIGGLLEALGYGGLLEALGCRNYRSGRTMSSAAV